jgi:GNAT superfamily N-acetyltransferase
VGLSGVTLDRDPLVESMDGSQSSMEKAIPMRMARLSDVDGIARLTTQLGYEVEGPAVSARLSRILARPDHRFLVAERDGRLVGWVHATVWESVEAGAFVVICGLVVDRALRRQGIGRALLANAGEWAAEQGCSVVRLWSSVARTEAHRFYEQLGYTNIKSQYSFVKSVGPAGERDFAGFIPRIHR